MPNFGIIISEAYISNQCSKGYDDFHQEKHDLVAAGLVSTGYQQADDTAARSTDLICQQAHVFLHAWIFGEYL